jgi:hypothetical protein
MLFRISSRGGSQENVKYTQQFTAHKRKAQIKSPLTKSLIEAAKVKAVVQWRAPESMKILPLVMESKSCSILPCQNFSQHENTTLSCPNNLIFRNFSPLVHCKAWSLLAFN